MDGIEGLLARDFGVRPQGKAAPMAGARGGGSAWPNPRSTPAPSYDGLFGAPGPAAPASGSASGPSLDSIFDSFKGPSTSSASAAAGTKPAFDDDFFNPTSVLRPSNSTSSTARYDAEDVFGTGAAPAFDDVFTGSNRSAPPSYDDFLGGSSEKPQAQETKRSVVVEDDDLLGGFGMKPAGEKKKPVLEEEDQRGNGFDDLIPGFPRSSPPKSRKNNDDNTKKPSFPTSKSTASMVDDPFVVLEGESASGSAYPSPGRFTDPLEDLDKPVNTEGKNFNSTADDDSLFGDSSAFDKVPKSDPSFTSESNGDTKDSHLQSKARDSRPVQSSVKRNPGSRSSLEDFENGLHKSQSARYSDIHVDDSSERYSGNGMDAQSPVSTESEDDIWLTVSEIPLFTRPTSAPPPSRSPPLLKQKSGASKANGKDDEYVQQSSQKRNHHKYSPEQADVSLDESEGFAMGRPQRPVYYDTNAFDEDEEYDTNSSAREERESQERLEQAQERLREEQRRREKEREMEQEKEKQAVERATKEARDRAAVEARAKAERDARQRSQRAAVQRANQEARVRAAAEAKDRVARAAAEERDRATAEAKERERVAARERAAAEAKERERTAARERATAERAATERVQQEARKRAERAAVERAAAEARQRHAAAAAAAAKEKQSTPDDLDSFFSNNAPKQRPPTVESMFDPQPQGTGTVNGSQRPASTSASTRKANTPSPTNMFGNGLSDLFEFEPRSSSDVFQDVEGESEERRRARLERHQRTRERAAKALAEKNERDMQVQREQAERDRIGDSLDFEIKRWAAGKEGNLRALLSTLQYILWPECGWQAVSLTDLITGAAVKKQYRRATLCIHPDKVQQKGATLQQKYIAEKVFDMLKEAWNKFNSEELF